MRYDIVALVLLAGAVLAWIYRRDKRRFEAERAMLFEDARGLLTEAEQTRAPNEYPRIHGRYHGHAVAIDAVLDTIAVRKLPSLWLRVTVLTELPFAGTCDVLARAHNVEFYSPASTLDHVLALPAGWPDHLTVKSDNPEAMPPEAILTRHIRVFDDPQLKELLVTPRGVRLVRQAAQGARAEYMVLRQAAFGPVKVPREQLQALLDAAVALAEALKAEKPATNGVAA